MGLWVWGESLGVLEGLVGEMKWELRARLAGEKLTVVEILGGGVGVGFDGVLGVGAKNREITACFCLPIIC